MAIGTIGNKGALIAGMAALMALRRYDMPPTIDPLGYVSPSHRRRKIRTSRKQKRNNRRAMAKASRKRNRK